MKDHNRITGNGRKSFPFYEQLDGILGHRPAAVPSVVLDAGSSTAEPSETWSGDGKTRAEMLWILITLILVSIQKRESDVQVPSSVDSALVQQEAAALEPTDGDHG